MLDKHIIEPDVPLIGHMAMGRHGHSKYVSCVSVMPQHSTNCQGLHMTTTSYKLLRVWTDCLQLQLL